MTNTLKSARLLLLAAFCLIGPSTIAPAAAQPVAAGTVEALVGTAVVTRYEHRRRPGRSRSAPSCSRAIAFVPTPVRGCG